MFEGTNSVISWASVLLGGSKPENKEKPLICRNLLPNLMSKDYQTQLITGSNQTQIFSGDKH